MEDGKGKNAAKSDERLAYRLCPRCLRAVPATSGERYCVNDGVRLLEACPRCGAPIASPYARFCPRCGAPLAENGSALTSRSSQPTSQEEP
ncbi:zinc ribbon domain-containing protein [Deinococcus yavapaiensis]|uniref:Double zinc ribbon protein n=1 Tax=Deinococcus yavapaiensis KR-236 TaxID=694435 RepID=A0A318SBA5_9DEIO|nr:zinc ribbon domain-containing protein [Deinococcus yavapaiensis]PYE53909.1 double zinc ribbon protein [Deinococcus yavapaiensis KR-236]